MNSLRRICFSIWRNKYDRKKYNSNFKPIFTRYIGVEKKEEYFDIIKTLVSKCEEHKDKSVVFDGNISMSAEFELINYINNELNRINIYELSTQEVTLFNDVELNNVFLKALEYVVLLALKNEKFFSESVRNDFITKLIVWTYVHLREVNFNDDINPKCVYYGDIQKHEIYFLMLMHLMSFDVIYINPLKEELFDKIDTDNVSKLYKEMEIMEIGNLYENIKNAKVIELTESITKQLKRDIEEELFTDTGVYRDWQFRNGYTKCLFMDTVLEDINIYWNEQAKVRPNFKVDGKVVTVPCFFQKIEGVYFDDSKYNNLVNKCVVSENTILVTDCIVSKDVKVNQDMYKLMFCQLSDGSFDIEQIKSMAMYNFKKYNEEVQDLILKKFNEIILDNDIFAFDLNKDSILQILALILNLDDKIIRCIDSFDFTKFIPKIVVFLQNEDILNDNMLVILAYLHKVGFDIVIFNPSGIQNTSRAIKSSRINITRLEKMNYTKTYSNSNNVKKKGFMDTFNNLKANPLNMDVLKDGFKNIENTDLFKIGIKNVEKIDILKNGLKNFKK